MMHYNLLYYGKHTGNCNPTSNGIEGKTQYLKTILKYEKPDIFTVNELDGEDAEPLENDEIFLLNNALNTGGIKSYRVAPFEEIYLANALFYNKNKFKLKTYQPIRMEVGSYEKIINAYTLYYLSDDLGPDSDTTIVTCFVAHLKAGSDDDNAQERNREVEVLRDFIANNYYPGDHFMLLGDLNVYSHDEGAFQQLINPADNSMRLIDPADATGDWHNNSNYAPYHTQSTHTGGDCFSGGGMDDRFDFIMASASIMDQATDLSYVDGSYTTVGQDGQSFNSSLNISDNGVVPEDLANALYKFSDHLPVSTQMEVKKNPANLLHIDTVFHNPDTVSYADSVYVYADLTDTRNQLFSLKLLWKRGDNSFDELGEMTLDGNYYTSALPPVDDADEVKYKITGYDASGAEILESETFTYNVELNTSVNDKFRKSPEDFKVENPVQYQLNIDLSQSYKTLELQLAATDGGIVLDKFYNNMGKQQIQLPVEHLPAGLYLLTIKNREDILANRKVILIK